MLFQVSRDTTAPYLTSVTKDRLPVFRTDQIKTIACNSMDEARRSAGFLIFAYVIMPGHLHAITSGTLTISRTLQFLNGIMSRRIISYLKEGGHTSSLKKLERDEGSRGYRHSLWDHHPNGKFLTSEPVLMEKINYIHRNPVRAGLVERAVDHVWSSARQWRGMPLDKEPLWTDFKAIRWRTR
ncbi:MAG TPA: transposase [Blastocatellia bacterium]|nr:transposase [Blastocatellia bacterium]